VYLDGMRAAAVVLRNWRKTECDAKKFLTRLAVRAAPFALLRNSRKTECGAKRFLTRVVVRAAPFALLSFSALYAQPQKFEAVSIRRCDLKSLHGGVSGSPGRVVVPCATVKNLIEWTYGAYANGSHFNAQSTLPIEGAPAWMDSERYTIHAKAAGSPGILAMFTGPLMQALLTDRFKLKFHRETRDVPVYAIAVGDGIPLLHAFEPGSCDDWEDPWDSPPRQQAQGSGQRRDCRKLQAADKGIDVYGATMREFAALIHLDRPVIDTTGITGTLNIHLNLSSSELGAPTYAFEAVRTALRNIGLDLQATKGPQEVIVIDHVERPTEHRSPAEQH
jgi:uncharacterized protein (TIGR03435 family)